MSVLLRKMKNACKKMLSLLVENSSDKGGFVVNLNADLTVQQPRMLLCYLTTPLHRSLEHMKHPNVFHLAQMVKGACDQGFQVDVCYCNSNPLPSVLSARKYDVVLGFGSAYLQACKINPNAKKILFVTENHPLTVKRKYAERLDYFKSRHPKSNLMKFSLARDSFYTEEMFQLSDNFMIISNTFNFPEEDYQTKSFWLNVNGIDNKLYQFTTKDYTRVKKNFVWLGSNGFIHKGVDLLIDLFNIMPGCKLHLYGISAAEKPLLKLVQSPNIIVHDFVDITSARFLKEVVNQNAFVISPSCSEGMMTGVVTGMLHGLIPIVTPECGIPEDAPKITIPDYNIEKLKEIIENCEKMSATELERFSRDVYLYSQANFSIKNFDTQFRMALKKITEPVTRSV